VKSNLNLDPDGFAISAYAFIKFMDHEGLLEKISKKMSTLSIDNLEELNKVSKEIQDIIVQTPVPPDLQESVLSAYAKLCKKHGGNQWYRSEAVHPGGQ